MVLPRRARVHSNLLITKSARKTQVLISPMANCATPICAGDGEHLSRIGLEHSRCASLFMVPLFSLQSQVDRYGADRPGVGVLTTLWHARLFTKRVKPNANIS